jgi:hypothetical protein
LAAQSAGGGGGGSWQSYAGEKGLMQEQARLSEVAAQKQREAEAAAAKKQRQWQAEQDRLQRAWEAEQERRRLEQQRRLQVRELEQARQKTYVDMLGKDPARAILFALGLGPEAKQFNVKAKGLKTTLKPLAGARAAERQTEGALSGLLSLGTSAAQPTKIDIGETGIGGLPPAIKSALAMQQEGADARKLLGSAYGVGSTAPGEQAGISQERLMELVQEVTPGQQAPGG